MKRASADVESSLSEKSRDNKCNETNETDSGVIDGNKPNFDDVVDCLDELLPLIVDRPNVIKRRKSRHNSHENNSSGSLPTNIRNDNYDGGSSDEGEMHIDTTDKKRKASSTPQSEIEYCHYYKFTDEGEACVVCKKIVKIIKKDKSKSKE